MKLRITSTAFKSISDVKYYIQEFTMNNGDYPDQINMDKEAVDKYLSFLFDLDYDRKKLSVYGIKIVEDQSMPTKSK